VSCIDTRMLQRCFPLGPGGPAAPAPLGRASCRPDARAVRCPARAGARSSTILPRAPLPAVEFASGLKDTEKWSLGSQDPYAVLHVGRQHFTSRTATGGRVGTSRASRCPRRATGHRRLRPAAAAPRRPGTRRVSRRCAGPRVYTAPLQEQELGTRWAPAGAWPLTPPPVRSRDADQGTRPVWNERFMFSNVSPYDQELVVTVGGLGGAGAGAAGLALRLWAQARWGGFV
jgi:hypothetical protein